MILQLPKYKHILRINPHTDPDALNAFKTAVRCTNEQGFDLNGIKEEPEELVIRNWGNTKSTSTEAREESKRLYEKYGVDNILDWQQENWGITCNVDIAIWVDPFTVQLEAEEDLSNVILTLAKKHNIEMYISHVEASEEFFEYNCGLIKFKGVRQDFELGTDKFEKYVFATVLFRQVPLSFKDWEKTQIPKTDTPKKYYFEHFIEDDARIRMKKAFNDSKPAYVANIMVTAQMSSIDVWNELSLLF